MVANCNNRNNNPSKSFFRFPRESSRRKRWIENLNLRESVIVLTSSSVCQDHFKTDQFSNRQKNSLKKTAVPFPHVGISGIIQWNTFSPVSQSDLINAKLTFIDIDAAHNNDQPSPPEPEVQATAPVVQIMENKQCILCYDTVPACLKKIEGTEDFEPLKNQMSVLFLLKNSLEIPEHKIQQILQEFGNPCSWIYWCNRCSSLVDQAEKLHGRINLMQRQFENLQTRLKTKIVISEKFNDRSQSTSSQSTSIIGSVHKKSPLEVVRSCILKPDEFMSNKATESSVSSGLKVENLDGCEENQSIGFHEPSINFITASNVNVLNIGSGGENESLIIPTMESFESEIEDPLKLDDIDLSSPLYKDFRETDETENYFEPENSFPVTVKVEKPYLESNFLENVFESNQNLTSYSCAICDKCFSLKENLTRHAKLHKRRKSYRCNTCKKFFSSISKFKSHRKVHRYMHEKSNMQCKSSEGHQKCVWPKIRQQNHINEETEKERSIRLQKIPKVTRKQTTPQKNESRRPNSKESVKQMKLESFKM